MRRTAALALLALAACAALVRAQPGDDAPAPLPRRAAPAAADAGDDGVAPPVRRAAPAAPAAGDADGAAPPKPRAAPAAAAVDPAPAADTAPSTRNEAKKTDLSTLKLGAGTKEADADGNPLIDRYPAGKLINDLKYGSGRTTCEMVLQGERGWGECGGVGPPPCTPPPRQRPPPPLPPRPRRRHRPLVRRPLPQPRQPAPAQRVHRVPRAAADAARGARARAIC
jgi:hypothetical protein